MLFPLAASLMLMVNLPVNPPVGSVTSESTRPKASVTRSIDAISLRFASLTTAFTVMLAIGLLALPVL